MKRKPKNKRQHYVPRHYLRLFADANDRIGVAALDPFRFIGPDTMKSHCQGSYFYGHHDDTDAWLGEVERTTAPMLRRIATTRKIQKDELLAIRLLVLILLFRTRKAAEVSKLLPGMIANHFVRSLVKQGKLPKLQGEWSREMIDFEGVTSVLLRYGLVYPMFEMIALEYTFLITADGLSEEFVTSDHPVSILNPFLNRPGSVRSFAGFARAGFQLILPIGPRCSLLFYDPGVYEILGEVDGTVIISGEEVDRINALQIQAADRCLIFPPDAQAERIATLHERFVGWRKPLDDHLRPVAMEGMPEGAVLTIGSNLHLPEPLNCWRIRERPHVEGDGYRNLEWTDYCERVADEFEREPGDLDRAMRRADEASGMIDEPSAPISQF